MSFGKSTTCADVSGPVRLTLYSQARTMAVARKDDAAAPLGSVLTVPEGWGFKTRGDETVRADIPDTAAGRYRRAYGNIGDAHDEGNIPNKSRRDLFPGGGSTRAR